MHYLAKIKEDNNLKIFLIFIGIFLIFIIDSFSETINNSFFTNNIYLGLFLNQDIILSLITFLTSISFIILSIGSFYFYSNTFINRYFNQLKLDKLGTLFLQLTLIISSITILIIFDLFNVEFYPLIAIIFSIIYVTEFFNLNDFKIEISNEFQYNEFLSSMLLLLMLFLILFLLISFYFSLILFLLKKSDSQNDLNSWENAFATVKLVSILLSPFFMIYLWFFFNIENNLIIKFMYLLGIVFSFIWMFYYISTRFYYGLNTLSENNQTIFDVLIKILTLVFFIPVFYWSFHDYILLNFYNTFDKTIYLDFSEPLVKLNILEPSFFTSAQNSDLFSVILLNAIGFNRILLFQIVLILLIGVFFMVKYNIQFIIETIRVYIIKKESNSKLEKENQIIDFINRILSHRILSSLFLLFIIFIIWDSLLVIGSIAIPSIITSFDIDLNSFLIFSQLRSLVISLFAPISTGLSIALIFLLFLLFISVLIIYIVVSIKLQIDSSKTEIFNIIFLLLVGFILINSFQLFNILETLESSNIIFKDYFITKNYPFSLNAFSDLVRFNDSVLIFISIIFTASYLIRKKNK